MKEHVNGKNDPSGVLWQDQLTRRTFLKLSCLAASLGSVSLASCFGGPPASPRKTPVPGSFQGFPDVIVPMGLGVNLNVTPNSNLNAEINRVADLGFRFVRLDLLWNSVERQQGQYDFSSYERTVGMLAARGMRPLFILDYTNPLYEKTYSPPYTSVGPHTDAVRQAFGSFAAAAAARFKGRGIIWEMWNEPDTNRFWYPKPDADAYSALAKVAIKAMRQADPDATIIGPGPIGLQSQYHVALSFLERCFQLGLLDLVDGISVHAYRTGSPESVMEDYDHIHTLIDQYATPLKVNLPIISSEWGYSQTLVSQQQQAEYFVRLFLINLMNDIPLSIWYNSHDGPNLKNVEDNFGLVTWNNQPKLASFAAQTLTRELAGYRFTDRIALADADDYALLFVNAVAKKQVVWTIARPHTVTLPVNGPSVTITSMTGKKSTLSTTNGKVVVELTGSPQYLSLSSG